jgi:hypothetical protein
MTLGAYDVPGEIVDHNGAKEPSKGTVQFLVRFYPFCGAEIQTQSDIDTWHAIHGLEKSN